MNPETKLKTVLRIATFGLILLGACDRSTIVSSPSGSNISTDLTVKILVGSALGDFCNQAIAKFNQQQPKLDSGKTFVAACEAKGSGDVVTTVVNLAQQLKNGAIAADAPEFPTIVSLDGEIYQSQLINQVNQIFPGQNYISDITESPLVASSPMVFMAQSDVAKGLRQVGDPFKVLVTAKTHADISPTSPALTIHYVQTAPTRSNSGLQTLVAQFVSVSGKRPEQLTIADVKTYQAAVQKIQDKVTRYGLSTNSLAKSMVKNGQFWATMGSVYESSVIAANSNLQPGQPRYEAVYPRSTFSSNMRLILPQAPWVSADEKLASEQVITYLRSPAAQQIATDLGLRPGTAGVALGAKFTPEFGVDPQAQYDSLRPPQPQVVEAMLKSWQEVAKKPSLVVIVVDSSGSMQADNRMTSVQQTLQIYINTLGIKDRIALIDFDTKIRPPVLIDGTPEGRAKGLQFVSSLEAKGATKLYDATLFARNWLRQNLRPNAINAVLVLTDGVDSGSSINLSQLSEELQKSGFTSDERIAFFTIGYGKEGEFSPEALQKIADLNGGYYSKGEPETIATLMSNLQLEF
jgi:Ca-activated chloride channel homolog